MFVKFFAAAAGCNNGTNTVSGITGNGLPQTCANKDTVTAALTIVFTTIGGLAFLFFVIAGARYIFAQGNPESIQKAKREMAYSMIGLLIAVFAAAFVNYVLGNVL